MPGRCGATDVDRTEPAGWVCSTMTTASAPRGSGPPVAIGVAVPAATCSAGAVPQCNSLAIQPEANRCAFAGRREIRRAHRKAVDIGTVERRHVDRRSDVFGERRTERIGKLALSLGIARGNSAASKRASASSRDRILRNCSCSSALRTCDCGIIVMPNPYHSRIR